jgi:hypothetical protein
MPVCCNIAYVNAPQCYVILSLPFFLPLALRGKGEACCTGHLGSRAVGPEFWPENVYIKLNKTGNVRT